MPRKESLNLNYYWKKKTILSFFAIFFVIIIHNSTINQYPDLAPDIFTNITNATHNFLAYILGAVAVPLFFFISSLTFFRDYSFKKYPKKLLSRLKTIVLPYLIWNLFGLLFAILYTYTPLKTIISGRELFTPTLGNILSGLFLYKYNFHFWFLFDLIIFTILTPLFNLLASKKWLAPFVTILLLLLPLISDSFLHIRLNFIIFYYLGAYISKHHLELFTKPASFKTSLIAGIITIITLIATTTLNLYSIPVPSIISELLLLILLFSVWFSSDLIIKKLHLHAFYSLFFPIYIIHPYIIAFIIKLFIILFPKTSWMLLINNFLSPILTILILIPTLLLWRRLLPKTYAFLFGERKK